MALLALYYLLRDEPVEVTGEGIRHGAASAEVPGE